MDQIVEGGLQPPIGVVANFDNPPSLGTIAKICWSFCLILSTIVVGARMGTVWKGWVGRKAGWEDCKFVSLEFCDCSPTGGFCKGLL